MDPRDIAPSSTASAAPARFPETWDVLRGLLVPALEAGTTRLVPSPQVETEPAAGFQEIFPYGVEWHNSFEWMCLRDGWSHIKIHDVMYRMRPGDVCFIPPGVPHAEMYSPATPPHQSLWFTYHSDLSLVDINLFDYDAFGHGRSLEACAVRLPALAGLLLTALQEELYDASPDAAICHSLFLLLTQYLARAFESREHLEAGQRPGAISRRVFDYLNRHYAQDVSLADVAHAVHLSRNYLPTVFKQDTGKTVGQALTEIRLRHAKSLLAQHNRSVREVAAAVGFRSPEHFCRVFQRLRESFAQLLWAVKRVVAHGYRLIYQAA